MKRDDVQTQGLRSYIQTLFSMSFFTVTLTLPSAPSNYLLDFGQLGPILPSEVCPGSQPPLGHLRADSGLASDVASQLQTFCDQNGMLA